MNEHDSLAVLKTLDRPVAPRPEFAEALRRRLLAELPETNGHRAWRPRLTLPPPPRRRRQVLAAALAIALAASALAAVLLSRPAPASALDVVLRARQQFNRLPPFQATIVGKARGSRISVDRRFYRDLNAWRIEHSRVVGEAAGGAHSGDYYVWDGRFMGNYVARSKRFYLTPASMVRQTRREYMATEDLDPHFYNWPSAKVGKGLPADEYFRRRCEVLPNEVVAGREARHLACKYGPYGRLNALRTRTVSVWLDAQYGFILKLAWPSDHYEFEVRKITINPTFPRGVFQVQAPPGSKAIWEGPGVPPSALRQKPSPQVAATIPVGSHPAILAAGAGSLWVSNLAAGSVSRIDPNSNRVISGVQGLQAYGMTYGAGSVWVATNSGRLERIDPASNRQIGPAIAVGGGRTAYRDVAYGFGTLWTVGGKVRTVHFPDGSFSSSYASLVRVDPATGRVVADLPIQAELADVADIQVGEGSVWVATYRIGSSGKESLVLVRVDPEQNRVVDTLDLGRISLDHVIVALGSVWLTVGTEGEHGYLLRIDPRSDRIVARIPVGESPSGIAVSPGAVWVTTPDNGTLSKIDPTTDRLIGTPVSMGDMPVGALYAYGALWVADNQDNTVVRINRPDLP